MMEDPNIILKSKKKCQICHDEELTPAHEGTIKHKINKILQIYQESKCFTSIPQTGIELEVDLKMLNGFDYNFIAEPDKRGNHTLNITPEQFIKHNNELHFFCNIKNVMDDENHSIVLLHAGILTSFKPYSIIFPNGETKFEKYVRIQRGDSYTVIIKLKLDECCDGVFNIPVGFYIQTLTGKSEAESAFLLTRSFIVTIEEPTTENNISVGPRPQNNEIWNVNHVMKPTKSSHSRDRYPIKERHVNTFIFGLKKNFKDGVYEEIMNTLVPGHVTLKNYRDFFHSLLWLEETAHILGLAMYNMENVKLLLHSNKDVEIEVPGLAEKRPSVIKGDVIEVRMPGDHTSYQGIVVRVTEKSVLLGHFNKMLYEILNVYPDLGFQVRFIQNRLQYERMHRAVDIIVNNGYVNYLFPNDNLVPRHIHETITLTESDLRNKNVFRNREQYMAISKIINSSDNLPYIVWGPPGTGKTDTIVETVYQMKRLTKTKRFLMCAPSNAACNLLTERLAEFCSKEELKRIMSESCDKSEVKANIVKFCNLVINSSGGYNTVRCFDSLKNCRIVVTTLMYAPNLQGVFNPDMIFIDEAAQAREPEVLCAISLLSKEGNVVVLAGDSKQLGPLVLSKVCNKYNFDVSLLERLMECPMYKNDKDHNYMTMLKMNFRSHAEILKLPNKIFYDNLLQPVSALAQNDPIAKTFIYKLIVKNQKYSNKGSPIEFCSVLGKERKEHNSPSYFNSSEVSMVIKYVEALLNIRFQNTKMNVSATDIGVITPYIKQCFKLRNALRKYKDVEVGTTEAFQGREKRIIIISTVRAQNDLLLYDEKYKVGFVAEPKRYNVAITRAKSKLIVIANPLVICKNEKWRQLMEQAKSLGTLCGTPIPDRNQDEVKIILDRLETMKLAN